MESSFRLSSAGATAEAPATPGDASACDRPRRADAVRNRASVLDAARAAFAEEGLEADMASIARRAGVGVGTVYRHFPTKDALLEALMTDHFERLSAIAERAEAEGASPWEAIEAMVWNCAQRSAEDHGLCEILSQPPPSLGTLAAAQHLRDVSHRLVAAGVADGSVRSDATAYDVPMMMCGFGKVAALQRRGSSPGFDWHRYLTIMLDGLRAR
jgi:AcrR family transcriptional regulator